MLFLLIISITLLIFSFFHTFFFPWFPLVPLLPLFFLSSLSKFKTIVLRSLSNKFNAWTSSGMVSVNLSRSFGWATLFLSVSPGSSGERYWKLACHLLHTMTYTPLERGEANVINFPAILKMTSFQCPIYLVSKPLWLFSREFVKLLQTTSGCVLILMLGIELGAAYSPVFLPSFQSSNIFRKLCTHQNGHSFRGNHYITLSEFGMQMIKC